MDNDVLSSSATLFYKHSPLEGADGSISAPSTCFDLFPYRIYPNVLSKTKRFRLFCFSLRWPTFMPHWAMAPADLLSLRTKARPLVFSASIYITIAQRQADGGNITMAN